MNQPDLVFESICSNLTKAHTEVSIGKMMSAAGLKYADKVFAFFHKQNMGFRLGPEFDPKNYGITNINPLSPFKTKAPLKGWFIIDNTHSLVWEALSIEALVFTKSLKQ